MDRHVHVKAENEWQQALELEKKLKASSRKKSFYDPEVRGLRKQLRDTYESLLFLDAAFAAANDVEGQMWRTVFYTPIEEFRTRIRKAEKEAQQRGGPSAMAGSDAATIMAKTAAAFLKFLDEAALFYKRLVMQLQSAYGDVKVRLELPPNVRLVRSTADAEGMQISTGSSIARDMRSSIHRCLVFLGDLSRYASQAAPKAAAVVTAPTAAGSSGSAAAATAAKAEWSKAVSYYRMAAHVLPRSGNPHNQLAVMAFMTGEELKAAYHYARSLCVHVPFMTARENLLQLLQSNRDRYTNLCKQRQLQQPQGQARLPLSMQQQLSELGTCYVRLCGLLYDKINQHEYPTVAKAAFEALAGFLDHPHLLQLLQRQRLYDCTPLHLVVLSIFMVHHSFGGLGAGGSSSRHHEQQQHDQGANGIGHSRPGTGDGSTAAAASSGSRDSTGGLRTYVGAPSPLSPIAAVAPVGSYGDAAQRSVQRSRALAMVFRTGRLLAQAATAAVNAEAAVSAAAGACNGVAAAAAAGKTGATCLLVGLNVVLQWLAAQPNCAVLQAGSATEEDVKARSKFWAAVGQLLLVLAPALRLYDEQQQQQGEQPSAAAGAAALAAAAAGVGSASGGGGVSGSMGGDASCEEGALPEDLELLGFEPMRSRHYWHVTDVGKHAVDETRTRIKRMLAAARVTSATLAADQQQQLLSRHLSATISAQALNQLSTAMAQFVEVVAVVASTRTPAPSPIATAAPAGGQPGVGGLARSSPGQQQHTRAGSAAAAGGQRAGATAGVTAMDIDTDAGHYHQQQQQQRGLPGSTAAAAGNAECEDEEEEEEVILFKPRVSRLSSAAADDALVGTAAAAAAAGGSLAAKPAGAGTTAAAAVGSGGPSGPQSGPGSGTAGPPPLPHILLAGRQPGSSAAASPTTRSLASPQHQQHQQHSVGFDGASVAGRDAAAAAPFVSGGMLLQGHAATALDLQQAQAASDILLARLNARQGMAGNPAAAAAGGGGGGTGAPGFSSSGGGMLAAQQQQQQWGARQAHGAAAGYQGVQQQQGLQQQQQHQGLQQAGPSEDVAMAQALLGTGLATLLGGLGDELLGPDPTAAAAVDAVARWGSGQTSPLDPSHNLAAVGPGGHMGTQHAQQYARQQQGSAEALAAVSAAVAASMQAAGLEMPPRGGHFAGPAASAAAVSMAMGLDDPLATLGVLGIPTGALGLSVGLPGSSAGMLGGQAGGYLPNPGSFQGFGPDAMEGLGGPMRTVSASAAAVGGAVGGVGRLVSAPVGILQQAVAEADAADGDFRRTPAANGGFGQAGVAAGGFGAQQEQLSSSYVANHQMEATAMDAANRVLSPDFQDSGMAMLQQRQQQQQLDQQQQQQGLFAAAAGGGADLNGSLHSRPGSRFSGSAGSTPRAVTPRGAGGLSAALQQQQQQQQQQLQAHMQQQHHHHQQQRRRLSAGSSSPRSAVGAERGVSHGSDGFFERPGAAPAAAERAGRMSVPSFSVGAAAVGDGYQQRQQRSSIGAMFAGPDLFAPSEQLPPMHKRVSSGGSSGPFAGLPAVSAAAAGAGNGGAGGGSRLGGPVTSAAAAAGVQPSSAMDLFGRDNAAGIEDLDAPVQDPAALLPFVLGDVLQGPTGVDYANGHAPALQAVQQQQHQLQHQQRVAVAESPDQGDEGLTLVEYLAAQQRKLQQQTTWGGDSSSGLQAAAAAGADLSAHVLLPPLDFAESQNPFG